MNRYGLIALVITTLIAADARAGPRQMETLNRGVVAVNKGGGNVYVGWRMLGLDPASIAFNLYRSTGGAAAIKRNSSPLTTATDFNDTGVNTAVQNSWYIKPIIDGIEGEPSEAFVLPAGAPVQSFVTLPLRLPEGGSNASGSFTYTAGDCSAGDLDGDGQYEIVLKWDPSNAKDNSQSGFTGPVMLDAYKLNGSFLWRINLGINIRAGAHYTQFMVYDLDGDGKAEVACKTAPGTMDGTGANVILGSDNPAADYRNSSGYILSGPEYLTIFEGATGRNLATTRYIPARGTVSSWGDSYGNRVDRFLACIAYLDGMRPSLVMCRGYYTRSVLAAWDWRGGKLINRWIFDSDAGYPEYSGQGNHNLSVGDVDGDARDEIVYGSCTINDDGTGLYSTGLGHGDAMHLSDMDPTRPGLEVWQCHEGGSGSTFRDARTGETIFRHEYSGDVGRACAAHIDSGHVGFQFWSSAAAGTYDIHNVRLSTNRSPINFLVWWDADLQRELFDAADGNGANPIINKWNGSDDVRLLSLYSIPTSYSTKSINGTKANPCLSADLFGDWREEIVLRASDQPALRIFTTTIKATNRFYTLMHDSQYRVAVAWQNAAYNQPPHPSFYVGTGMSGIPAATNYYVGGPPVKTPSIRWVGVTNEVVTLKGGGGTPGRLYYLLSSTNPIAPFTGWTRVATNVITYKGEFSTSITLPSGSLRYFALEMP